MRTTIKLDDSILTDLMRLTDGKNRTEAVNKALADWVKWKKIKELKAMRGKIRFEGDLTELRGRDIAEIEEISDPSDA